MDWTLKTGYSLHIVSEFNEKTMSVEYIPIVNERWISRCSRQEIAELSTKHISFKSKNLDNFLTDLRERSWSVINQSVDNPASLSGSYFCPLTRMRTFPSVHGWKSAHPSLLGTAAGSYQSNRHMGNCESIAASAEG